MFSSSVVVVFDVSVNLVISDGKERKIKFALLAVGDIKKEENC